ncbi:RagB/SusD family nutrient uptake outer membrane protein [Aestuariibaculum sp. M13]|uniref:RagB/SusD family nutrient uptake outer membrane protein n=1 Tax=Aestuariibaculum sp. M13 TaxID=2967132 RepID=UPI00215A0A34|nr:RagB/SusD family nutrient uptake outer membrane protein [Aestuariibaculum sp. M13]MCR8668962.1 RagB/SusD family nutrient uptake outer membrane protein [Aestuariibaculum sp. M13]
MKKYLIYIYTIAVGLGLTSCDDYVDIKTEGKLVPEETINYRYLLNNTYSFDRSNALIDLMSDDIAIRDGHAQYFENYYGTSSYYRPYKEVYKWADSIYYAGESDYTLNTMYSALYLSNVVISEVMNSNGGTELEKAALKGEALVHRAFVFLELVNLYGKAYDVSSSATDPGIPMFTEPTVEEEIIRTPVEDVYNQIVSDLEEAIASGMVDKQTGRNIAFPSLSSAFALLARTYLYMGNYTEALKNAEAALDINSSLINLEDYENAYDYSFFKRYEDPELMLSKQSSTSYIYSPTLLSLSDEVLNLFDSGDLRYTMFTRPIGDMTWGAFSGGRAFCREILTGEARNAGPTVPEMMLIKAECLARANDTESAMQTINTLRMKRFKAADYVDLTATDSEDALLKVLEERRRELMGKGGFRWFDLKRLNKDVRFAKTITHKYLDQTFTLEPEGNRYQFPFASTLFNYAPNLEQNP